MKSADNVELNMAKESKSTNIKRRVLCSNSAKPEVSSDPPGSVKIVANETAAVNESTTRRVLTVFFQAFSTFFIVFSSYFFSKNFCTEEGEGLAVLISAHHIAPYIYTAVTQFVQVNKQDHWKIWV